VDDDVGVFGRAGCVEVELLGGQVAAAVAPLDLGGGLGRGLAGAVLTGSDSAVSVALS
jgi:hypothetical protein